MKIIRISQNIEEDWQDNVDYLEELNMTLEQLLTHSNVQFERMNINGNDIIVINDGQTYVCDDPNDKYPTIKEAQEWIYSMWDAELDMYVPDQENDFWEYPSTLYHATDSENIPSIMEHGLRPENKTRGLSNRDMGSSIFTSTETDDIGSYGDTILAIDTKRMKQDGFMPEISGETPLEDSQKRSSLAHSIGYEDYHIDEYSSEGYSYNTIAIYGLIPPKYLKILESL